MSRWWLQKTGETIHITVDTKSNVRQCIRLKKPDLTIIFIDSRSEVVLS